MKFKLTPAQKSPLSALSYVLKEDREGKILHLGGKPGSGRTLILRVLQARFGMGFLDMKDVLFATRGEHPLRIEEPLVELILNSLKTKDSLIIDDLGLLCDAVGSCSHFTPRSKYIDAMMTVVASHVRDSKKTLVLGGSNLPHPLKNNWSWGVERFQPIDYQMIAEAYIGAKSAAGIDFKKVHRYAPHLNGHSLRSTFEWLSYTKGQLEAQEVIDYLRSETMKGNVDLGDVEPADFESLKGMEDVIASLESNIVLPLEHEELAEKFKLSPRKGVLLAGPPGTGKTTIGKALARRLRGKFFLIDGTVISGTGEFYQEVNKIFENAEQNSPAVVFIDDSDVIFQGENAAGLYRYLLTKLDGLEGKGGRVCLVLTAMDVADLPPALVRSGRVEVWLETKLPDQEARREILAEALQNVPDLFSDLDLLQVAEKIEGFTGADIVRLAEDAKVLMAYDVSRNSAPKASLQYFDEAIETFKRNKVKYSQLSGG